MPSTAKNIYLSKASSILLNSRGTAISDLGKSRDQEVRAAHHEWYTARYTKS